MTAVNNDTWMLILLLAVVFSALVAITAFFRPGQPGQHQEQNRG